MADLWGYTIYAGCSYYRNNLMITAAFHKNISRHSWEYLTAFV